MRQENTQKTAAALAAVDEALERARVRKDDVDLVELYEAHEAFAVVALAMAARKARRGLGTLWLGDGAAIALLVKRLWERLLRACA